MSSRLIIKNLPSYYTASQLREHILSAPTSSTKVLISLTDLHLVLSKDGTSRRFAFLGFPSHEVASAVKNYFDRTYIDTSRVSLDFAKEVGDSGLEERKEKFRDAARGATKPETEIVDVKREERGKKIKEDKKEKKEKGKEGKGVSFEDFLSVMAPSNMRRKKEEKDSAKEAEVQLQEKTSLEKELEEKRLKKERKEERKRKREEKEGKKLLESQKVDQDKEEEEGEEIDQDKVKDLNDEGLTDLEYMYRRMRRHVGGEDVQSTSTEETTSAPKKKKKKKPEKEFQQSEDEDEGVEESDDQSSSESESEIESDSPETKSQKLRQERFEARKLKEKEEERNKQLEEEDFVMKSGRLFVRNLPFGCKEEELREWFEDDGRGGEVSEVHIPVDRSTKQSKGLGFIKFSNPSHALQSLRNKNGSIFQGRLIHILAAVDQSSEPTEDPNTIISKKEREKTLKQKKLEERKENAGGKKSEFEWSMLYMNQDSVASSIANRLGISKNEVLNSQEEGGDKNQVSSAVKLALAETHLIKETREWLESQGLDFSTLVKGNKNKIERSDTTILVKNFPFGTKVEELREMFEVHGEVEECEMAPSGTIALVEMLNENEARKAFKGIAYKRFGGGILYLEKGPKRSGAVVKRKRDEEDSKGKGRVTEEEKKAPVSISEIKSQESIQAEQAQAEAESIATLYIKNLSFSTTNEKLKEAFSSLTDFTFARVQTKPAPPPNNGIRLSMGYGFVGFKSFKAAESARKVMDGCSLDGHSLSISFAKRGQENSTSTSSKPSTSTASSSTATKILVKNLPFEATKQDVRSLFQAHSTIKSVRAPRKLGGKNSGARGFAFVEFFSNKEAKNAMEALKFTHLLGRHLILSFADDDESMGIEESRNRAKLGLGNIGKHDVIGNDSRKRKKVRLGEEDVREAVMNEKKKEMDQMDED